MSDPWGRKGFFLVSHGTDPPGAGSKDPNDPLSLLCIRLPMCGRMPQTRPLRDYAALFEAAPVPGLSFVPRYNLAPFQKALAVRPASPSGRRELWTPTWGLVFHWARERRKIAPINARIETVATRPVFRETTMPRPRGRMLRMAGSLRWKEPLAFPEGLGRAPGPGRALGLLEASGHGRNSGDLRRPRPSAREVRFVHGRMPVILGREKEKDWLDPPRIPGEDFLTRLSGEGPSVSKNYARGLTVFDDVSFCFTRQPLAPFLPIFLQ